MGNQIGDKLKDDEMEDKPLPHHNYRALDEYSDPGDTEPYEPEAEMPEADDWDADAYDKYISASVMLPQGGQYTSGCVVGRKRDYDGKPIGTSNSNPILDTRVYDVEFPDGHVEEFTANVIAECIYS